MAEEGLTAPLSTSEAGDLRSADGTEPGAVPERSAAADSPAEENPVLPVQSESSTAETATSDGPSPGADGPPAPDTTATTTADGEAPMSKRQRKRLAKREAFLAQRPALRRAERQRRKEKRAAAVAAALAAGTAPPKRPRLAPMSSGSGVQVVIDLSFDDLMTERDLGKCLKQVQRCYAANRRSARPIQLILTSMEGESRRLMDANDGWQNWDVRIERSHLLDVLPPETVTYLTSDSEHQLDVLEPGRAYVIGGLVDHNHHKGECLRRATEAGIRHARLPIDDFMEMKTRKVLTIDHVFSILLLVAGGSGWQQALQQVLPARKGAVLKEGGADTDETAGGVEGEEGITEGSGESGGGERPAAMSENARNGGTETGELKLKNSEADLAAEKDTDTGGTDQKDAKPVVKPVDTVSSANGGALTESAAVVRDGPLPTEGAPRNGDGRGSS